MDKSLRVLSVVAVAFFCLRTFSDNKADVDLWGNVGFVKVLPWQAQYHYNNAFSFTEPEHDWINHEWLAEYIFHHVHAITGNTGLLILKTLLGFAVMLLMFGSVRRTTEPGPATFFYFLLIVCTMGYGFGMRPHHFTYLLYALMLFCLRHHPRSRLLHLLLFPAIAVLWANFHGAFFIGLLLLAVFTALSFFGRRVPPNPDPSPTHNSQFTIHNSLSILTRSGLPAAAVVLFFVATLVNPYGLRLWEFIFQSAAKFRPYLSEWSPFNPVLHAADHTDFLVLVLLTAVVLVFSRRPRDPVWLGVLAISLLSAIMMRRNIPLFAITVGFTVTEHIEDVAGKPLGRLVARLPRAVVALVLVCFILLSGWSAVTFDKEAPLEIEVKHDSFAVDAVSFMKQNNIKGNALVFFDWAEYCIWHLPDCPVFLDGRFRSAYSVAVIDDYFQFLYMGPSWNKALDDYPTDIVLIHKDNPASTGMRTRKDWTLAYSDEIAVIFLKTEQHGQLIRDIAEGRISMSGTEQQLWLFP